MSRKVSLFFFPLFFLLLSCNRSKPVELYHAFPGNQWPRFNKLSFEIPVEKANQVVDLVFFARFTPEFSYETLDFNMVLRAAGEERIHEYSMKVDPKEGSKPANITGTVFEISYILKKQYNTGKPGTVVVEIESLTPRLTTEGIAGAGIRMIPSGQD